MKTDSINVPRSPCVLLILTACPITLVILRALYNLSSSFTITFTFNNNKTVVEIHYNLDKNILTSSLIINNINIHSLRSICLSTYLL